MSIKIEFNITELPTEDRRKEKYLDVDIDGTLKVFIDNDLFFDGEILLVHFAIFVKRWLNKINKKEMPDFAYESDVYEDEGIILGFTHVGKSKYKIDSIWKKKEVKNFINKKNLVNAFEKYLNELDLTLQVKCQISLEAVFRDLEG